MKQALLLCFIGMTAIVLGQSSFYRVIGGEEYDAGHDIVEVPADSGFYVVGTSGSYQVGHSDAFLMKTTKEGWVEWSRNYGGSENEAGLSMEYINNVGLYLMGRSNSSSGDYDAWVTFVDEQGVPQWERTYDNGNWEEIVTSALTSDSGLVVGIHNLGDHTNDQDISILRLDPTGDTVWVHTFNAPGYDEVSEIKSFQDSLFAVVSNRYDTTVNFAYSYLELYHEDGTILWSDTLNENGGDSYLNDFFISNDTLFAVGSHTPAGQFQDNFNAIYRLGTVQHGVVNQYSLPGISAFIGDVVTNFHGSNLRYSAYSFNFSQSPIVESDFCIALHANNLGWLSGVDYSDTDGVDRLFAAIPTLDSGAIFVGHTASGQGTSSICLAKIGPNFDYPTIQGVFGSQDLVNTEEHSLNTAIQVFPNPTDGNVTVISENNPIDAYKVIDLNGKVLVNDSLNANQVFMSHFDPGVYLLQLFEGPVLIGMKRIVVR